VCVITLANSADITGTDVTDSGTIGAVSMAGALSFNANEEGTVKTLSISGQSFSPKVGGSYGRL
jgi:hypothetical protein